MTPAFGPRDRLGLWLARLGLRLMGNRAAFWLYTAMRAGYAAGAATED